MDSRAKKDLHDKIRRFVYYTILLFSPHNSFTCHEDSNLAVVIFAVPKDKRL